VREVPVTLRRGQDRRTLIVSQLQRARQEVGVKVGVRRERHPEASG
jgi:hypothetical protein